MGLFPWRSLGLLPARQTHRQRLHRIVQQPVRQECLNEHWFLSLEYAKDKIEAWRSHYNEQRPHSSLGYQTPASYLSGALPPNPCTWKQALSERWKSSSGRCPLPVADGNCVVVRRGGKQPEANLQSIGGRTRFGRA